MNILITGADGFVGKNLAAVLSRIKYDGDQSELSAEGRSQTEIQILPYDLNHTLEDFEDCCRRADFVFHLAGVNRPESECEFMEGNYELSRTLVQFLKKHNNRCPVMFSSSIQAELKGRYTDSAYGKSKKAAEDLFSAYSRETGVPVYIYRFPGIFGKWCRPDYNSVVATFSHNIAHHMPIQIHDAAQVIKLAYIDDVVAELTAALYGRPNQKEDGFCYVPTVYEKSIGEIAGLLYSFQKSRADLYVPDMTENSFSKKLYAAYLSYLPQDALKYPLNMHIDERGSFTEMLKTSDRGQVSVNITSPGVVKGNHYHHTKCEKFIVLCGEGFIQLRKVGTNPETGKEYPVIGCHVSGARLEAVDIPAGYIHSIQNTGVTDLVTLIWCSEVFDEQNPDTYYKKVQSESIFQKEYI